jgi:DNA/RNA endonuclease G (NUC1)
MSYSYVVTGAVYEYPAKVIGVHKVPVPVSYYKIVYLKDGSIKAFEAENKPKSLVVDSTVDAVEKKTGIKFH